ncbi:DUF2812 domain-containing protein [Peptostreptococcus canis]|uniref:DUF2812 domain-containing protein n=1 Tax=Peptostreptococcus canis TaxID=1159213 RepID=A0ABR6TJI4_9FIRM|nr:DUF2812 domain-containing protein [Peptostreptococcus canis]MBC2575581.1 DUF2812 domain-containing protein [Peptostreptococcus canis]MBP1997218.1 hypothetical protein [Peptostreptococcus canis]
MDRRKTRVRFFTIADYLEEEKWLEEQHKKGWKLLKMIPPCFFIFEECDSEEVIYQLDYKDEKVTEDYLQMYKDYGWEYLGSCFGWNYFRKLDINVLCENDRKIFSDTESKISMIEHIFRTRMLPLLIIFFAIIIPNLIRLIQKNSKFGGSYLEVFYISLFILYLFIFIYCGLKLKKLKKEFRDGY